MSVLQTESKPEHGIFYFDNGAIYDGDWTFSSSLIHNNFGDIQEKPLLDHNTQQQQQPLSKDNITNNKETKQESPNSHSNLEESNNNRIRHGKGIYKLGNNIFDGQWINDKLNGNCIIKFESGCSYEGNIVDNVYHGFGIFKWPNNKMYKGEWDHGRMHGHGEYVDENERVWSGLFYNGNGPGLKYHIK